MEGHFSTGQSPQSAVVPMKEEKEEVSSIFIPKNVMLVILDLILLSQMTLMAICEFLVKKCMRLVFSEFSENKFALNQLLIPVNAPLMSFIKLIGLGLVMIRFVSSGNKTNLDLLLVSLVLVIFVISLLYCKNNNDPSIEPCSTPYFTIPQLEQNL